MSGNGIQLFLDPGEELRAGIQSPFLRMGHQMQDIMGDGGILKELVHAGEGPPVPRDATVLSRPVVLNLGVLSRGPVHFSAFLEYFAQPLVTTRHLKYPRMMKLGRDVTLYGLELGLLTMRKGEFSRFLFQPQYAYGEMGCPPLIPPEATILYEVQILDFLDSAQVDDFYALSPEEQNDVPLSTLLKVVDTQRSFGNRCFYQSRYEDAKDRYKQAMTLLNNRETESQKDMEDIRAVQLPLYLNLALIQLRLDRPHRALKYGHKALDIDPNNTKALYRCGQACLEMHEFEKAQDYLMKAQANKPFDTDINNLLRTLALRFQDFLDKEKDMCSKMFKDFNSPVKK